MAPDKLVRYPPYSLTYILKPLRDALSGVNEGIRVGGHLIKKKEKKLTKKLSPDEGVTKRIRGRRPLTKRVQVD